MKAYLPLIAVGALAFAIPATPALAENEACARFDVGGIDVGFGEDRQGFRLWNSCGEKISFFWVVWSASGSHYGSSTTLVSGGMEEATPGAGGQLKMIGWCRADDQACTVRLSTRARNGG